MKKILIVEDEEFLVDAYLAKFQTLPYQTLIARDGEEAVNITKTEHPDVIILDLLLPKKNGLEVLKNLMSDESTKHIPVIIASNVDRDQTIEQAIALGAKEYFVKNDVSVNDILQKVLKYLDEQQH